MIKFDENFLLSNKINNKYSTTDIFSNISYDIAINPHQSYFFGTDYGQKILSFSFANLSSSNYLMPLESFSDLIDLQILEKDKNIHPNSMPIINLYDSYFGNRGRIYLSDNVILSSNNYRSKIYLNDDTGITEIQSYNLLFRTEDSSVKIYTSSSSNLKFGDSLFFELTEKDNNDVIKKKTIFGLLYDESISIKNGFIEENKYYFDFYAKNNYFSILFGNINGNRIFNLNVNEEMFKFDIFKTNISINNNNLNIFTDSSLKLISTKDTLIKSDSKIVFNSNEYDFKNLIVSPIVVNGVVSGNTCTINLKFFELKVNGQTVKVLCL